MSSFEYPLETTEFGFMAYLRLIDPGVDMWPHPKIQMAFVVRPSEPWFHQEISDKANEHRTMGVFMQVVPWNTPYGYGPEVVIPRKVAWWRRLLRWRLS